MAFSPLQTPPENTVDNRYKQLSELRELHGKITDKKCSEAEVILYHNRSLPENTRGELDARISKAWEAAHRKDRAPSPVVREARSLSLGEWRPNQCDDIFAKTWDRRDSADRAKNGKDAFMENPRDPTTVKVLSDFIAELDQQLEAKLLARMHREIQ